MEANAPLLATNSSAGMINRSFALARSQPFTTFISCCTSPAYNQTFQAFEITRSEQVVRTLAAAFLCSATLHTSLKQCWNLQLYFVCIRLNRITAGILKKHSTQTLIFKWTASIVAVVCTPSLEFNYYSTRSTNLHRNSETMYFCTNPL